MKLDQIGFWSEIKLEIIKKYAGAYTSIMSRRESLISSVIENIAVQIVLQEVI